MRPELPGFLTGGTESPMAGISRDPDFAGPLELGGRCSAGVTAGMTRDVGLATGNA
jgi:hypothetical protein